MMRYPESKRTKISKLCCMAFGSFFVLTGVFLTLGFGNKGITSTILSDLSINNVSNTGILRNTQSQLNVDELKLSLDELKVKFENQQSQLNTIVDKLERFIHAGEICDAEQEMRRFIDAGGAKSTHCPDTTSWINKFAVLDPSPEKMIIIVGCNKGINAVDLFSQYDNSLKPFNPDSWRNSLKQLKIPPLNSCGQVSKPPHLNRGTKQYAMTSPTVYCIEPMSANIDLLKQVQNLTGLNNVYFKVLQYAIGDPTNETVVHFPTGFAGQESLGISNDPKLQIVKYTSLDLLFSHQNIEKIDILSIDTEGNDPAVLYGAAETLKKTRYMEFEVHHDYKNTLWGNVTLQSVIQYVDDLGFECFWINQNGLLFQITNCWHSEFHKQTLHSWGNIGCVKRQDQWYTVLKQLHKKQTS